MRHKNKLKETIAIEFKSNKRKIFLLCVLIFASLIPASLLFLPGFPVTDDGTWLIIRFSAFFETLRTGQIPVRFIYRLNDGFGYPVSNFLYPLYLYLATPIHVLGFNFLNSIKILLIFNIFLSAVFTYLWLNKKFSDTSSFIGALVLILSPYFLFDLYKRGSVGELLTFSIVPFILWQIERRSIVLLSLGFFLLILAHNTLGFLFLILILFYAALNKFSLKSVLKSLVLGLGLSAFFWIPALYDLPSTVFSNTKVSNFYDYLFKFSDFYLIGVSTIFIISVSIFIIFETKNHRKDLFFISSIILTFIIIFIQLPQSKIIWETFPLRDFIQFPFRLLSVMTILLSFQAAFSSNSLKKTQFNIYTGILIIILIIQAFFILDKVEIQKFDVSYYSTNQSTTTVSNEYLSKWFIKPDPNQEKIQIKSGEGNVVSSRILPGKINLTADFKTDGEIQINSAYFPGWVAYVNGISQKIYFQKNGFINLKLDKGSYNIDLKYRETGVHLISDLISLTALTVFFLITLKTLRAKYDKYFE